MVKVGRVFVYSSAGGVLVWLCTFSVRFLYLAGMVGPGG